MTDDLHRTRAGRARRVRRAGRARRLTLLAASLVSLGLWTGVAGASDAAEPTESLVTVELPGWNGETVEGDAAALLARIAEAMADTTSVDEDGNRWTGVGGIGNRWTGSPLIGRWGNRWDARNI
jgi:hypothetical protein